MRRPIFLLLALLCLPASTSVAQESDDEDEDEEEEEVDLVPASLKEWGRQFSGVQQWQVFWEVSVNGAATRSTPGGRLESRYEETAHGSFLLERATSEQDGWEPKYGVLTWRGNGEARGGGQGVFSQWENTYGVGEEWQQQFKGSMEQQRIELCLTFGGKTRSVTLHPGIYDETKVPTMHRTGRRVSLASGAERRLHESPINESFRAPVAAWYLGSDQPAADRRWQVVSPGPGVLAFSYEGPTSGRGQGFEISGAGIRQRSRVLLSPVYDNLEVQVTIAGYADWRPMGSIADTKKPGNDLTARATLRHKDGKPGNDLPAVKRFRFELIETSREPGICMNWPLDAKDADPDLRLAYAGTGGELSAEDQKLSLKQPPKVDQQQPYAEVRIESYDFGGRAELRVICELEDGRELVGLLKDEAGEQDLVRLPKRDGPDWIAEKWRKDHDVVELAANHDEEEVKGQKHNGDGFTLYEEYRGFVENGRHISGEPKRKDLFILNLAHVQTRSGIALFERLARIKAHARLKEDGTEMALRERLMNGNHRDAPHRVDQHGVILSHVPRTGGRKGWETIGTEDDSEKAFRPRTVSRIYVERPDAQWGMFSADEMKKYNLDHLNPKRLYAAGVAHELLHSIGVDHHGEATMSVRWAYFQGPSDPMNPTHKMRFTKSWAPTASMLLEPTRTWEFADRGDTLTLLWEDNKQNLVEERAAAFSAALSKARADNARYADTAETIRKLGARFGKSDDYLREYLAHEDAEDAFDFLMFVGQYQGTDSGDESCVMRYYFANAYEAKGGKDTFYIMRPGVKQGAVGICTSPEGTGGNAPSHNPQSRFGPAAGGRGNCFGEICPNDAIPPRNTGTK